MKAQLKKLTGCASNLLAHEDLGHFEEAHHWSIQAKFYSEKSPLVYESDHIGDSLSWRSWCYFEAQVWKRDSNIAHFFFSSFFSFFSLAFLFFLWPSFFSLGFFFRWGQCSNNDDHHTSIYLQLMNYNLKLEQDMTLYECLRRCNGMGNESRVTCMKIYAWQLCHKYEVNYMIMQGKMTIVMYVMMKNGTVESCMAIYLGMAMEMP